MKPDIRSASHARYATQAIFRASNTMGFAESNCHKPRPSNRLTNNLPKVTPATKGRLLQKPKFAPDVISSIFAGPGVPTINTANKKNGA